MSSLDHTDWHDDPFELIPSVASALNRLACLNTCDKIRFASPRVRSTPRTTWRDSLRPLMKCGMRCCLVSEQADGAIWITPGTNQLPIVVLFWDECLCYKFITNWTPRAMCAEKWDQSQGVFLTIWPYHASWHCYFGPGTQPWNSVVLEIISPPPPPHPSKFCESQSVA